MCTDDIPRLGNRDPGPIRRAMAKRLWASRRGGWRRRGPPFRPVAKDGRVGARGPQMTGLPTGRLDRRTADCGSFARAFMSTPIRCTRCFGAVSIRMARGRLSGRGEGMEWPQPSRGSGLGPRALRGASPLCRVGADREMSRHDPRQRRHLDVHRRDTISTSPPSCGNRVIGCASGATYFCLWADA